MRSDIKVILIFVLHLLRDLREQTEIFVPKSFKIVKLYHLTMQNVSLIYALLYTKQF